jgi:hypothetical protein
MRRLGQLSAHTRGPERPGGVAAAASGEQQLVGAGGLTAAELALMENRGYVVVSNAAAPEDLADVVSDIWSNAKGMVPDDPGSWYDSSAADELGGFGFRERWPSLISLSTPTSLRTPLSRGCLSASFSPAALSVQT